jgi:hypothetical protein
MCRIYERFIREFAHKITAAEVITHKGDLQAGDTGIPVALISPILKTLEPRELMV